MSGILNRTCVKNVDEIHVSRATEMVDLLRHRGSRVKWIVESCCRRVGTFINLKKGNVWGQLLSFSLNADLPVSELSI